MFDFNTEHFMKLRKIDKTSDSIAPLLIEQEEIVSCYKGTRDYVVFTNKRIIAVDVQGATGKKKDFTTLPYSKIQAFSIETSGVFDIDCELELWYSGLGVVRFEFTGTSDMAKIGQIIAGYVL